MSKVHAIVDRIEDDMAVLLVGDENARVIIPKKFLPDKIREGDVLNLSLEVDPTATKDTRKRVQDLIDKLDQGNRE